MFLQVRQRTYLALQRTYLVQKNLIHRLWVVAAKPAQNPVNAKSQKLAADAMAAALNLNAVAADRANAASLAAKCVNVKVLANVASLESKSDSLQFILFAVIFNYFF